MLETRQTVCGDCGGTLIDYGEFVACEFVDAFSHLIDGSEGVVACGYRDGYAIDRGECEHGIEYGGEACGSCRGSWDLWIRSKTTGAVLSAPDLVSWFVPSCSAIDGGGKDWRGIETGQGEPSTGQFGEAATGDLESGPTLLDDPAAVRPFDLGSVGAPFWYRGETVGVRSVSDACATVGLDWYGMSELHAAEVLASLLPAGVISLSPRLGSVTIPEASGMYRSAAFASRFDSDDCRDRLRAWRRVTGRSEGAGVFQ